MTVQVECKNCGNIFDKPTRFVKKQTNHFCSSSCSASFNNKKRKVGKKRSKLELWLEPRLQKELPDLEIHFNRKDAIGSELDIYIPSLKLAIELNGRFHYEPVFGQSLLEATQKNDQEKRDACKENNIHLIEIDVSSLKFLTTKRGYQYLRQISNIVNNYRNSSQRILP